MTGDRIAPENEAAAFWVSAPGRGEIRPVTVPTRGADDVLIRTLFTGISRGTESLIFNGRVPRSEYQRMRAPFQEGEFPAPVKYGYINVGVVEAGPADLVGQQVFSLYPHQTRFVVPRAAVHVLPEGVPAGRAILTANLETAITGVWDAAPVEGDRAVVIGAGTVGCLVAWLLGRTAGVSCTLSDINENRAAVAHALGVSFATPAHVEEGASLVVHTSGSPAGLSRALEIAAPDTTIVEMSWYGDREVCLPLGGAFHARRLTLKSSQVGTIPPSKRGEWTHRRRMEHALRLLSDPALDVLITGESGFEELPALMAHLSTEPGETLCHRVRY